MLFLIESIQAIPGNRHFQGQVEYGTLLNFYFGKRLHYIGQFFLYGALQSNVIQSIVLISQASDSIFVEAFQKTCGLSYSFQWVCKTELVPNHPSPFNGQGMLFTLGYLCTLVLALPLGLSGMDNSITVTLSNLI